jgi:hypothetical protein
MDAGPGRRQQADHPGPRRSVDEHAARVSQPAPTFDELLVELDGLVGRARAAGFVHFADYLDMMARSIRLGSHWYGARRPEMQAPSPFSDR